MARRLAIRVKSISGKPRKKGSKERYCTSKHSLKNQPAEKYQELEILLNTTGIKSDGMTTIEGQKLYSRSWVEKKSRVGWYLSIQDLLSRRELCR